MKLFLKVIAGICMGVIIFASCKKSAAPQSDIIGKWKNIYVAVDTNNNGIMDASEIMPVDSLTASAVTVYNSGGSGQVTVNNITVEQFTWELHNNNSYLRTVTNNILGGSMTNQHIDSLTSKRMVLKDTSGISAVWEIFVKQ